MGRDTGSEGSGVAIDGSAAAVGTPGSDPGSTPGSDPGSTPGSGPGSDRAGDPSPTPELGRPAARLFPPGAWLTTAAFAVVLLPFLVALVNLLATGGGRIYLPDDLALIDLHTRRALAWKQQLGVFDHYGWNHPGPSYFYLLSVAYRLLGSGARAMFVGATALNMMAAVAVVAVVRRRTGPARALWAATWVCLLAGVLAASGPSATTYSESTLGALVSPWNPTVVIFPLLLFTVLCAAAVDRSPLSLLAALVVGSFVIQTDISVLPLVAALFAAATAACLAVRLTDRRGRDGSARAPAPVPELRPVPVQRRGGWRGWWWVGAGSALFVLMWIPPVIQQLTNHPGNFTLLVRFFTSGRPGQSVVVGVWSVVAVLGVLAQGPAEVMNSVLGSAPAHATADVVVSVAVVVTGMAVTVVGVRQNNRFAATLGALGLIGCVATGVAVTRVTGLVFGYLVIWAVVLPVAVLIGLGVLHVPVHLRTSPPPRLALCAVALVVCVLTTVRTTAVPPLSAVSDPEVGQLVALVTPAVGRNGTVFVGDDRAGAGGPGSIQLIDIERFVGLVNRLDQDGYHPVVSSFWKAEFGPGYLTNGRESWVVQVATWRPSSPALPGYRGKVGDMSVVVYYGPGHPVVAPRRG